jgi:oxalate decarboxylase
LTYCLEGKVLVSILDSGSEFSTFSISEGQMFHVASGSLHHIENIGDKEAVLIVGFRHEQPEDFSLHGSFGAMSDAVLGNTYDQPASAFAKVARDTTTRYIVPRKGKAEIPDNAEYPNPHKFDIEAMLPPVAADGVGSAKTARSQYWPALKDIAMYSLRVEEEGMREPHWHPNTGELGYVNKGHARMSIMDPDGSVDTYVIGPGDMYFIPSAYPHQIEVIGEEEIHFLIFFDQPMPYDVGYRASATAISREVMASTFGLTTDQMPEFPRTFKDPLLVGKLNPIDPVTKSQL